MQNNPYFFGYGSLVNRTTHDYVDIRPATAQGWRRLWRHTALRPFAILTAVPAPGTEIEGLIAAVPGADWQALDDREFAYDRVAHGGAVLHDLSHPAEIAIYTIPEDKHPRAEDLHPIQLSYLDVVVQGYLREFGEDGAERFFATTEGWDSPVLDDRAAPLYPRHRELAADEQAFVDAMLARLGSELRPVG